MKEIINRLRRLVPRFYYCPDVIMIRVGEWELIVPRWFK